MPAFSSRRLFALPIVAAVGFTLAIAAPFANSASAGPPTVVELYQSQGCSSCPPANENILTLTDRPDPPRPQLRRQLLGSPWLEDTFASRENTQRQYDFTNGGLKRRFVATPQVVINGQIDIFCGVVVLARHCVHRHHRRNRRVSRASLVSVPGRAEKR
jgi:hypothetical protein